MPICTTYKILYSQSSFGNFVMDFCFINTGNRAFWLSVVHNTAMFASEHHANHLMLMFMDFIDFTWLFSGITVNISTPEFEINVHSRFCTQTKPYTKAFTWCTITFCNCGWSPWKHMNSTEFSRLWTARIWLSGENFMDRMAPRSFMQNEITLSSVGPLTTTPVAPPDRTAKIY